MRFQCPKCHSIVTVDPSVPGGSPVKCGKCQETVTTPANSLSPGAVIGDFVIIRELSHGGMGIVFLAHQISLDRPAALKVLQEDYTNNEELVGGLIREARSAAKLNHPNIVQAYAVGEDDHHFYFAMEFIDGETMKDVLKRDRVVAPLRVTEIIIQIAEALNCAWKEQRLVHQDIKPDNIMLTKNGQAKLADLGLSQVAGEESSDEDSDEVLGTPQYISPEQLTGQPVDCRSDIYSLGATFYHLVTGHFPYEGDTVADITRQHVEGNLKPPKAWNPLLPEEINRIIIKMMARDINSRYQTEEELLNDLRAAHDGRTTNSRHNSIQVSSSTRLSSVTGQQNTLSSAGKSILRQGGMRTIEAAAPGGGHKISMIDPREHLMAKIEEDTPGEEVENLTAMLKEAEMELKQHSLSNNAKSALQTTNDMVLNSKIAYRALATQNRMKEQEKTDPFAEAEEKFQPEPEKINNSLIILIVVLILAMIAVLYFLISGISSNDEEGNEPPVAATEETEVVELPPAASVTKTEKAPEPENTASGTSETAPAAQPVADSQTEGQPEAVETSDTTEPAEKNVEEVEHYSFTPTWTLMPVNPNYEFKLDPALSTTENSRQYVMNITPRWHVIVSNFMTFAATDDLEGANTMFSALLEEDLRLNGEAKRVSRHFQNSIAELQDAFFRGYQLKKLMTDSGTELEGLGIELDDRTIGRVVSIDNSIITARDSDDVIHEVYLNDLKPKYIQNWFNRIDTKYGTRYAYFYYMFYTGQWERDLRKEKMPDFWTKQLDNIEAIYFYNLLKNATDEDREKIEKHYEKLPVFQKVRLDLGF